MDEFATTIQFDLGGVRIRRGQTEIPLSWDDVWSIAVVQVDCKTHIATLLELGFECGEFVELITTDGGFYDLVKAITERYALTPSWFDEAIRGQDRVVEVWSRFPSPA